MLRAAFALLATATLLPFASPVAAETIAVDVELVLAVDVSASIDRNELELQRTGYTRALTQPTVIDAMLSGPLRRIALTFVEWSQRQRTTVGWTIIDSPAAAYAFAAAINAQPLPPGGLTSIRGAIDFSVARIEENAIEGTRRVIDISSDGRDWEEDDAVLSAARQRALDRGIVINALAIRPQLEQGKLDGINFLGKYALDGYLDAFVAGGPGSFTMVVEDPTDFPQALARKLVFEVSSLRTERQATRSSRVNSPF